MAVAFFGDGAVNEGVWYESLNFASLRKLPVVFVCENNLYSTHMPIGACLADTDISKKAAMFNMPGIRVDGNNAIEVFLVAREATERARRGEGPTLVECMTYRWRGHVGPNFDLDKGLRSEEELRYWMERCPIKMIQELMLEEGVVSDAEMIRIHKNVEEEIENAVHFAEESPYPSEDTLLSHVFKD